MFRKVVLIMAAVLVAGSFTACFLDPEQKTPDEDTQPKASFEDLSERWHVLHNLEAAYNQKIPTEYDRILDDAFVFFFSQEDFSSNRTPEQWDRSTDVPATQRLMADVLDMELTIDISQLSWIEVTPDTLLYPGETWSTTTVPYSFTMRFNQDPETTYITSGTEDTQFTVRPVDVDGKQRWRLVEWRDLATTTN